MAQIICLANSRKLRKHCIAGINIADGQWIRPVIDSEDGALPRNRIMIGDYEPKLLDIIEVPLQDNPANTFGFQPENRLIAEGIWSKIDTVNIKEILEHCEDTDVIFYNNTDRVPYRTLLSMPIDNQKSLKLIRSKETEFHKTTSITGKSQCKAIIKPTNHNSYDLVVTDPIIESRVFRNDRIKSDCVLTISLGMPFDGDCYKLIAGVIEL